MVQSLRSFLIIVFTLVQILPSVANAYNTPGNEKRWMPICTMNGIQMVQVDISDDNNNTSAPDKSAAFFKCPLCVVPDTGTKNKALTPVSFDVTPVVFASSDVFYATHDGISSHQTAYIIFQSRAPPALS